MYDHQLGEFSFQILGVNELNPLHSKTDLWILALLLFSISVFTSMVRFSREPAFIVLFMVFVNISELLTNPSSKG